MSIVSDFFTQSGFWAGAPIGVIVGGIAGAAINAWSTKASDKRKSKLEDTKATREAKEKSDQRTREECAKFAAVCVDVINAATDTKGVFNMVRDQAYAAAGLPDPRTTEKIDYAELQATENQRLAKAYAQLKLVAPNEILDKALELNTASLTLLKVITQPLAKPLLAAKAGQALDEYTNAVRAHLGLDRHSTDEAQRVTATYLQTLKEQVDDYLTQAEEEARASSHT